MKPLRPRRPSSVRKAARRGPVAVACGSSNDWKRASNMAPHSMEAGRRRQRRDIPGLWAAIYVRRKKAAFRERSPALIDSIKLFDFPFNHEDLTTDPCAQEDI